MRTYDQPMAIHSLDNDMAIDVMVDIIITDENLWSTHGHTLNQLQMPLSLL